MSLQRAADKKGYTDGDGVYYPSATTILDVYPKWLDKWKLNLMEEYILRELAEGWEETPWSELVRVVAEGKRAHWAVSDEAKKVGSQVHDYIERYYGDGDMTFVGLADESLNCIAQFKNWDKQNGLRVVHSERAICHPELGAAGTFDLLARDKASGKLVLVDFKTSKDFYPSMWPQLAFYASALELELEEPVEEVRVLRFVKKSSKEDAWKERSMDREAWLPQLDVFRACAVIYNNQRSSGRTPNRDAGMHLIHMLSCLGLDNGQKQALRKLGKAWGGDPNSVVERVHQLMVEGNLRRLQGKEKSLAWYVICNLEKELLKSA